MTFKTYMRDLLPHKDECAEEDRPILNPITVRRSVQRAFPRDERSG